MTRQDRSDAKIDNLLSISKSKQKSKPSTKAAKEASERLFRQPVKNQREYYRKFQEAVHQQASEPNKPRQNEDIFSVASSKQRVVPLKDKQFAIVKSKVDSGLKKKKVRKDSPKRDQVKKEDDF